MGKKQMMVMLVIGAVAFSAMSIASIVTTPAHNDFGSFAVNTECKAQGDFMPRPFDSEMMAPLEKDFSENLICSGEGGIKPGDWDDYDEWGWKKKDTLVTYNNIQPIISDLFCSGQGDIKPGDWDDYDEWGWKKKDTLVTYNNIQPIISDLFCSGQGDIKPRPWDDDDDDDIKLDAITHAVNIHAVPTNGNKTENKIICSGQGDIKPRPWDDDDDIKIDVITHA